MRVSIVLSVNIPLNNQSSIKFLKQKVCHQIKHSCLGLVCYNIVTAKNLCHDCFHWQDCYRDGDSNFLISTLLMLPVPAKITLVFWIILLIKSLVRNWGDCIGPQGSDSCRRSSLFEVTEKIVCLKSQSSEAPTAAVTLGAALELVFSQDIIWRALPSKKYRVVFAQKEMPFYGHGLPQKKQLENLCSHSCSLGHCKTWTGDSSAL